MRELRPDTLAVRGGLARSDFDETAEALFLTCGYVYELGRAGRGGVRGRDRHVHLLAVRQPDGPMFEERLRLRRGRAGVLRHRDRDGGGLQLALAALCGRATAWSPPGRCSARASSSSTRSCRGGGSRPSSSTGTTSTSGGRRSRRPRSAVFFESPSNPMQELVDVRAVCDLAHAAGAHGRRRQRLRDAAAAEAAGARRRHRRVLGDEAHRRPGPRRSAARSSGPEEYIDGQVQTSCATPGRR